MSSVVVTGATGFVGRALVKRLLQTGRTVLAVCRAESPHRKELENCPGVETVVCPLNELWRLPELLKGHQPQLFYHLAWRGANGVERADPVLQTQNMLDTLEAARAAEALGCQRFIATGTISERVAPTAIETGNIAPNTFYAFSKHNTRLLLGAMAKKLSTQCVWAQLANLYGPGDGTQNLISYTVSTLKKRETPTFSGAGQPFDFLHIEDCVEGLWQLGTCALTKNFYYMGSGEPRLLRDYLSYVGEQLAPEIPLGFGVRPDDGVEWKEAWYDIESLKKDTGYQPQHPFWQAVRELF